MVSAAFSAIMTTAALGWPLTMLGIVDHAQPFDSPHAQLTVDDGQIVIPHSTGPDRVIQRLGVGADERCDLGGVGGVWAGEDLIATEGIEGLRLSDAAAKPRPLHE